MTDKQIIKSSVIVGGVTLLSRILGLVRDVFIAGLVGTSISGDVFIFASKIPNFFRRLFAEGAFAQAFVPTFTEYEIKKTKSETDEFLDKVFGTLGISVTIITLIGVVLSPLVVALFGTGWFLSYLDNDGDKFVLASLLLKITIPYVWFITLVAFAGSILNMRRSFAVTAFTPIFLNISIIASSIWLAPLCSKPEIGLAWGIFIGGALQLAFQLPFLMYNKIFLKPTWGFNHPGVKKIRKLMLPAILGSSIGQVNLFVDTIFASFLVTGSVSWLYYSERLLEFPLGVFSVAISIVILPSLTAGFLDINRAKFQKTMDWSLKVVITFGFPAMLGLITLAKPIVMVLFMHNNFLLHDVYMVSYSLIAYGTGLMSLMLVKVLATGFYARFDSKSPLKYGLISLISNIILNIILSIYYGFIGLAIATSISAFINMILLWYGLKTQGVYSISKDVQLHILKVVIATIFMVMIILYLIPDIAIWEEWTTKYRLMYLMVFIGGGVLVYAIGLIFQGIRF